MWFSTWLKTYCHFPLPQVMSQTEAFLQQLLMRAVAVLPQWKVRVQKCKAVQMVLNLCSPSVTDKCLIAEAWCPTAKLPELQSALRDGGVSRRGIAATQSCKRGHLILTKRVTSLSHSLHFYVTLFSIIRGRVAAGSILSTTGCPPPLLHRPSFPSTPSQLVSKALWKPTEWPATVRSTQVWVQTR